MNNKSIDALDLLSVLLAYITLHNYEENIQQNYKLDRIIIDMEEKLNYQDEVLKEILRKVERENGE